MRNTVSISIAKAVAGVFMILTLLWLTVSTPFVYAGSSIKKEAPSKSGDKTQDDNNPFSGTTEEKSENGVNTISEYLHEQELHEQGFTLITSFYKCPPAGLYFAYHPELISPPPEA